MNGFHLVTYDIPDDKRRLKVSNELLNYGVRVQYSVFECLLNRNLFEEMAKKIHGYIDLDEDSVRYYSLCESCKKRVLIHGRGEISSDEEFWII